MSKAQGVTAQKITTQNDTLGFFLFLAFALHLIIILGVSFSREFRQSDTIQLEVTLAHQRSESAPEQARFVAQDNQLGSGDKAERAELTTRELADFSDYEIRETGAAPRQAVIEAQHKPLVATLSDSIDSVSQQEDPQPEPLPAVGINPEVHSLNADIASLEARLDEQEQAYAERPRVRRLTSLSARRSADAAYLYSWRTRVEAIGNQHYPEASSRYGIYGDLRLLVAIGHDGSIQAIEILASSGHAVLDEAAIRIVRMAAPYEPFPEELRATTDRLEIIRTWKFRQNRLSSVQG
jgi:protein TonB